MHVVENLSDRLLGLGDGLIISFPQGGVSIGREGDLATLNSFFFRVSRYQKYFQRYTQLPDINDGNTEGFNFLGDTGIGSGDDIFRIENDGFHVLHFGYGTFSPDLRVYEKVSPQTGASTALDTPRSGDETVNIGDDNSYITSKENPEAFDPKAFTERVAFRNDREGEFLQWGFEANGSNLTGTETDLIFTGRGYKLFPEIRTDVQKRMIQDIASKEGDVTDFKVINIVVGGIQSYKLGENVPDKWDIKQGERGSFQRLLQIEELDQATPNQNNQQNNRNRNRNRQTQTQQNNGNVKIQNQNGNQNKNHNRNNR